MSKILGSDKNPKRPKGYRSNEASSANQKYMDAKKLVLIDAYLNISTRLILT